MCLSIVYQGKQKKEVLAKLPERFYVWKRTIFRNGMYYSESYQILKPWRAGRRQAPYRGVARQFLSRKSAGYKSGWHAWLRRVDALKYGDGLNQLVRCLASKRDIVAIGVQDRSKTDLVLVFSHLTFPVKCGTGRRLSTHRSGIRRVSL